MYHLLTSDEFDAEEARRVGLVQEVVPAGTQLDRAIQLAEKICEGAPQAVPAPKVLLWGCLGNARMFRLELR